jgi:phage terminase large subunit-like protein
LKRSPKPARRSKAAPKRATRRPRVVDQATAYAKSVTAGKTLAGPYVRLACERHLSDIKRQDELGLRWDIDESERACAFFASVLILSDGSPFVLQPFQAFVVGSVFGWRNADGSRRFKTAYVEQGKGNGKTPTAAGIGVLALIADGEPSPEVYAAATMQDQASICWRDAKGMVERNEELRAMIEVLAASLVPHGDSQAVFRAVSSEHRGLDGKRPYCALIDELHEHPNSLVVDKMRAGLKARKNGFIFEITNSGDDLESVCWHHHEYSAKVLEGIERNEAWFAYICALEENDDWRDEACWLKANPGLDTILPRSYLREQVREAQGMPSKEGIVKRLNFCIWTQQHTVWIPMDAWRVLPVLAEAPPGWTAAVLGLDLSSKLDLTSGVVLLKYPDDGPALEIEVAEGQGDPAAEKILKSVCINFRVHVVPFFWRPKDTLHEAAKNDRASYDVWAREGWLRATPGPIVDYNAIRDAVVTEIGPRYNLKAGEIAFDPYNAEMLTQALEQEGYKRVQVDQTVRNISEPAKVFEALVVSGRLSHDGNPCLAWNVSNVAVREDKKGNIFPFKPQARKRIDGVVALITGLSRLLAIEDTGPSIWDRRVAAGEDPIAWL